MYHLYRLPEIYFSIFLKPKKDKKRTPHSLKCDEKPVFILERPFQAILMIWREKQTCPVFKTYSIYSPPVTAIISHNMISEDEAVSCEHRYTGSCSHLAKP